MSLADQLQMIKNSINEAERELLSLSSGRKVSSSRVRKHLQTVKAQSQLLRKAVIAHTKEMPTKKRPAKIAPEPEEIPEPVEEIPELIVETTKKKRIAKSKTINH